MSFVTAASLAAMGSLMWLTIDPKQQLSPEVV
jgi:hypothetical protein